MSRSGGAIAPMANPAASTPTASLAFMVIPLVANPDPRIPERPAQGVGGPHRAGTGPARTSTQLTCGLPGDGPAVPEEPAGRAVIAEGGGPHDPGGALTYRTSARSAQRWRNPGPWPTAKCRREGRRCSPEHPAPRRRLQSPPPPQRRCLTVGDIESERPHIARRAGRCPLAGRRVAAAEGDPIPRARPVAGPPPVRSRGCPRSPVQSVRSSRSLPHPRPMSINRASGLRCSRGMARIPRNGPGASTANAHCQVRASRAQGTSRMVRSRPAGRPTGRSAESATPKPPWLC